MTERKRQGKLTLQQKCQLVVLYPKNHNNQISVSGSSLYPFLSSFDRYSPQVVVGDKLLGIAYCHCVDSPTSDSVAVGGVDYAQPFEASSSSGSLATRPPNREKNFSIKVTGFCFAILCIDAQQYIPLFVCSLEPTTCQSQFNQQAKLNCLLLLPHVVLLFR